MFTIQVVLTLGQRAVTRMHATYLFEQIVWAGFQSL